MYVFKPNLVYDCSILIHTRRTSPDRTGVTGHGGGGQTTPYGCDRARPPLADESESRMIGGHGPSCGPTSRCSGRRWRGPWAGRDFHGRRMPSPVPVPTPASGTAERWRWAVRLVIWLSGFWSLDRFGYLPCTCRTMPNISPLPTNAP